MTTELSTSVLTKLKAPSLYKVILLNDDYTPMPFVLQLLEEIFQKTPEQAEALCMQVHEQGRGVAGIYSKEVADQKVFEVTTVAKAYRHPLKSITEVA